MMNLKWYKKNIFVCFLYQCIAITMVSSSVSYPNLEDSAQDFVLETRRIQLSDYPLILNPSIVRWNNSLLMSFRIHDLRTHSSEAVGLVWLDENFKAMGKPYILNIPRDKSIDFFINKKKSITVQDPRLITVNNQLYIVYSHYQIGRVFMAEMHFDGKVFLVDQPECFLNFENANPKRIEKNWVPFEYNGNLLFSYSISPHKVLLPIKGLASCATYACTQNCINWGWGELRGGTPALLIDGHYLSFFHSSIKMKTVQSNGEEIDHYFMGAYLFDSQPPFRITHVSPEPIIGKDFYSGKEYKTWKPLRVVFPAGVICDDNFIWVSYGKQDHESWIVKFDKNKLLNSLKPI